jgi:hypothetical protein
MGPKPVVHGGGNFGIEFGKGPVIVNLELGFSVYGSRGGRIATMFVYGAGLGTVW